MDSLIKELKDLKTMCNYEGSIADFKSSDELVDICIKSKSIAKSVKSQQLKKKRRDDYFKHLCELTTLYLSSRPHIETWDEFCSINTNKSTSKLLFDYGVRGQLFQSDGYLKEKPENKPSETRVTIDELYDMCKIRFNFKGTKGAFKKHIQNEYGSYAEYCLQMGYDINATKWEDPQAALRCANKIGNIEDVKKKSPSLYNYLSEKGLMLKKSTS